MSNPMTDFERGILRFTEEYERPIKPSTSGFVDKILKNALEELHGRPDFSEEVYFGQKHPFATEMMTLVGRLREEMKELLGGEWADESERTVIIKKALEAKGKSISKLTSIISEMEKTIASHCNIERCYIGLEPCINAHTIPMVWDSSMVMSSMEDVLEKKGTRLFIKGSVIRSSADVEKRLMTLEDICINKDGWRFKESKGKVFIISLGIPLIVDNDFESSVETICGVIFHELGHNFQQVLHGCNQQLIDSFITWNMNIIYHCYDGAKSYQNYLMKFIKDTETSPEKRYDVIKALLIGAHGITSDGKVITRDQVGKDDYKDTMIETVKKSQDNVAKDKKISWIGRILGKLGLTLLRSIQLLFAPISSALNAAKRNGFNKTFAELIKENKKYEQFADAFAVSYGFNISDFHKNIEKLYENTLENGKRIKHPNFLNYIPYFSQCLMLDELRSQKFNTNLAGYDVGRARIANMYKSLQYELQNNPDLSADQKKEITANINKAKESFLEIDQLEAKSFGTSPSLTKKMMEKVAAGTIDEVADETGFAEMVLDVINKYEKTGKIAEPTIVSDFKEVSDISKGGKSKIASKINGFLGVIKSKLGLAGSEFTELGVDDD